MNKNQKTAVVVDEEVQNILNKAYKNTTAILKKNIKTLRQVAKELMEKETIDGKWVAAALKKYRMDVKQFDFF